jgi:hypothetical protein
MIASFTALMERLKSEPLLDNSGGLSLGAQFRNIIHQSLLGYLNSIDAELENIKGFILYPKENDWNGAISDEVTQQLFIKYKNLAHNNFCYPVGSFAFSIPAAVHRQISFTDKIYDFGWLHGPFTSSTINRARDRYLNFFELMSDCKMLQPELDIDLVWHTHLLSPSKYREFCLIQDGKIIYHDDKFKDCRIDLDANNPKTIWEERFSTPFTVCLCWVCEETRSGGVFEDQNVLLNAIANEKARRHSLGLYKEPKFELTGCKDCGHHPRTSCASFALDKAVQNFDADIADSGSHGSERWKTECDNGPGCDCEEYCSECGCTAPCENPNCYCQHGQTCVGKV